MAKDKLRSIELLAPARNVETGIQAIIHGADAVYIGASSHGARSAAGNSIEDALNKSKNADETGVEKPSFLSKLANYI